MTDNSDKIRSLVLAALMVFSVFAGSIAFAGSAAAVDSVSPSSNGFPATADDATSETGDITINVTNVSSADQTVTANVSVTNGNFTSINSATVSVTDNNSASAEIASSAEVTNDGDLTVGIDTDTANVNVSITFDQATVEFDNVEGETDAQFSASVSDSGDGSTASSDLFVTTLNDSTADNTGNATVRKATHYVSDANGAIIEIAFTEAVNPSGETFTVGFDDGSTSDFSATHTGNGRVIINTSGEVYSNVRNVTVPSALVDGSDDVTVDVRFAPTTVNADDDVDGYVGSNIAFEAGSTDTTIDFDGPSFSPTRGTGAGSYVYVVDTDDFDTGTYNGTFGDSDTTGSVDLSSLGLSVSADDVTTDDAVTATVESNDINRDVDVALLDSDDDVVASDTVTIDSDGEATYDFGMQDAGNYTVMATDVATDVEATDAVNVTEAAAGNIDFAENTYSVAQGGVAEITLDVSGTTEGSLVIGQDSQSGYQANVTFTDEDEDGEVTILFNTYTAGNTNATIVEAAGEDSATLAAGSTTLGETDLLAQGGYDLAVVTGTYTDGGDVFENGDSSFSSLSIGPRSTDSMQLWTAPRGTGADALLDSVTQDTTIAQDDWVVHQISASGLDGLVEARGNFSNAIGDGLNVTVEQTESSTLQNRGPKSLDLAEAVGDGDIALIADAENDSYYIALDTSTDAFERSNGDGLSMQADEEYTATFTVDDSKLVGEDAADHESVNATFEVVERSASLDSTPVMLEAAEGQNITGTSTLAPGSEFTVTVQSTDDTSPRFYNNPTATVQDDGTWSISVDLSEQSAGDTFAVSAMNGMIDADGEVVENAGGEATATPEPTATATPEPTATATPEPTATATEEPTATATEEPSGGEDTDTEQPEDTTTTTTPGFGVAVALVALLAAALLAGRRE